MKKKLALRPSALVGLTLLASLWLAACGDSTPTTAPATTAAATAAKTSAAPVAGTTAAAGATTVAGTPAATTTAAATGAKGGTAVVAIDSDPDTLNLGATTGYSSGDVGAKIFNGLVWLDGTFTPQPSLATSWTISDDGKTYSFKLRSGVTWHDGKPFTSDDVKFTMEEILAKYHPRTMALMKRVKSVETPDPLSVVVTLSEPYAPYLLQQTVFDSPILPKHIFTGTDILKNPASSKPIGTGPFKFVEWNRGSSIRLARNENYWEAGKPLLDGIVFQIVPQGANRSSGLETGEIDFVVDFYLQKSDVKRLESNPKLQPRRGQGTPAIDFITLNTKTAALATKEARQAVTLAVNRKRMVDQAMGGLARTGKGPFGDGFKLVYNPDTDYDKLYPYDVEKAKTLLDTAGVKAGADGSRGTLRLVYDSARPQFVSGAQLVKENLKLVGFNVELQPLERSVMIQKVFADRDFDLTFQSFSSSGDPAIGYHRLYLTNATKTQFLNASGYSNLKVDELLNKAAVTPKSEDRVKLYTEVQTILAADLPSIVLFDEEGVDFASKRLSGLWTSSDSRDRWDTVSLAKS